MITDAPRDGLHVVGFHVGGVAHAILQDSDHKDYCLVRVDGPDGETVLSEGYTHKFPDAVRDVLLGIPPTS